MNKTHLIGIGLWSLLLLIGGALPEAYAQSSYGLDPIKALTQYHLEHWSTNEGLPQGSVRSIVQTPDGYLWLGTQEGLVRFDGLDFHVFDKFGGYLQNNYVAALTTDHEGSLWVGTRGGGLTQFRNGEATTYTTADGLSDDAISTLLVDREGALWVGTYEKGLNKYEEGRFSSFNSDHGLASKKISVLYEDPDGIFWIGTRDEGLSRFQNGRFTTFTTDDGLASNDVTAITQTSDGVLWIGTRDEGLSRFQNGRFTTFTTEDGLPENSIFALHKDHLGTLWVGTNHGGLSRLHQGVFSTITTAEGLAHDIVLSLYEGREGSLWIGTDGGGLNRLRDGKITTYTTREGLSYDQVLTLYEDQEGALWAGTEGGGVSRLKAGKFTTYTTQDGLSSDVILTVYGTRDGSIWFGTPRAGLNRLKDGQFTTFTDEDGLPNNSVYALYEDDEGALWIATSAGLGRFKDGVFTTYTSEDGLSSSDITAISQGPDGDLWIGTYDGGLNRIRKGKVIEKHTQDTGLSSNFVLTIFPDQDGTIWFGTRETGLNRLKDGVLTNYTTDHGLYNDNILQILDPEDGSLWISSNRGLFSLDKRELDRFAREEISFITPTVYDQTDGLRSSEFNGGTQPAGWKGHDGRLWFPTTAGIVSVDPERIHLNEQPPLVVIEQANANEFSFLSPEEAIVPPGFDRFAFHYVGLSFLHPDKVTYRYKLEGFDADWVKAGTNRVATYANLDPGPYTFRVMACNNDGICSDDHARISFHLEPFFYQTWTFYLLCAFSVLLLGIALYHLRVRHLTTRQHELEQLVAKRTQNLQEEKEKTEKAKYVIEAQADQLREMDRIKSRFFGNISHEFRTPLTLNIGPLENALTGLYGSLDPTLRQQLEVMLRNSRRLLRLINQLLDLSKLESNNMKLCVEKRNVIPLLEGIMLSFSAFSEKKQLDLVFSPPADTVMLYFDQENLEKVFFNLLSNAIKFTPEQGRIEVSLIERKKDDNEVVEIRVTDSGQGIPTEELPYIFDRFRQVDGTMSQIQEGTGIGLALVKELVELHDGTIHVDSEVGKGTTFLITLPKTIQPSRHVEIIEEPERAASHLTRGPMVELAIFDGEASPDTPHQTSHEYPNLKASPGRETLLIVDDNADIRSYIQSCLHGIYTLVMARDGVDGLNKAREYQPSLIISDVMMPRMNGYEFCRTVKAEANLRHIPVILLTSKASFEDKIEGLQAGADEYLTKPFNAKELRIRVRNLLTLHEQQRTLSTLNNELNHSNHALREASDMKSQLLRIAAHDMKNPLNAIREFTHIIKEEINEEATSAEFLDLIFSASDQMLHMISQLLDSEALESGKLVLDRAAVSMNVLAKNVAQRFEQQAARKHQTLHVSLEDDTYLIYADPSRLQEAMDNLVSNAVKYSPLGASIWIAVLNTGSTVQFEVRDEGPGLTKTDKEKLFGKFQKLSAQPTANESSTGLGLSIVKQIIEMHGGRVWATSKLGEGSTFMLELQAIPVEQEQARAPQPGEPRPPSEPTSPRKNPKRVN